MCRARTMKRALSGVNRYNSRVALILRSARVVLREHDKLVIAPARIHMEGALISRVEREPLGPHSGVDERGSAREQNHESSELDLGERLISPAFVNAHTHLALAFL